MRFNNSATEVQACHVHLTLWRSMLSTAGQQVTCCLQEWPTYIVLIVMFIRCLQQPLRQSCFQSLELAASPKVSRVRPIFLLGCLRSRVIFLSISKKWKQFCTFALVMSKEAPNVVDKHVTCYIKNLKLKNNKGTQRDQSLFSAPFHPWLKTYAHLPSTTSPGLGQHWLHGNTQLKCTILAHSLRGSQHLADFFQCRFGQTCAVAYI